MSKEIELRNDNYVFILGAGFSAARGLPLIADFFNVTRDAMMWVEEHRRFTEMHAIRDVLAFRRDAAAAAYRVMIDLENIEELFSLSAAASPDILQSVKLSISATLSYALETRPDPMLLTSTQEASASKFSKFATYTKDGSNVASISLYDALLVQYLNACEPGRSTIITFNYDDVVETSLRRLGLPYSYGFRPETVDGKVAPSEESGLKLLKLHGSMNWATFPDAAQAVHVFTDYKSLIDRGGTPVIVPPTWNKYMAGDLERVWKESVAAMATATKIVIIGFSMPETDLHFKYLLAAGMRENLSLREIVFVDPGKLVQQRAATLFNAREIDKKRVRFIETTSQALIATSDRAPDERGFRFNNMQGRPF